MTTTISWDDVGSRFFEVGVDRVVLYPLDGSAVAWNGCVSIEEKTEGGSTESIYFDGVKYAVEQEPTELSGTITAYTYPDEFLELEGIVEVGNGLFVTNQESKRFSISYRTFVGNDTDGNEAAYKIHIWYNLITVPSDVENMSISEDVEPLLFSWDVTSIPPEIPGFTPSAHLIIDSRKISEQALHDIETALYGDGISIPNLPPAETIVSFIYDFILIRITDNGDGTFTAEGPDNMVILTDPDNFQINRANIQMIDADSYHLSDTIQ